MTSSKTLTAGANPHRSFIPPEAIREQVARILAAPDFVRSRQLSAFLRFVVGKTIAGEAKEIKQYTVGVGALGRKRDFDPQTDPIVRITAGRLRRSLICYYQLYGVDDPVIIEIPTGTYVPTFRWSATTEADQKEASHLIRPRPSVSDTPTLALLSFEAHCHDDEQRFFGDSLGEELAIALHRFHHLQIVGPISRENAGVDADLQAIARHYRADFVFSGRVLKSGDKVKIVARLVDTRTGKLLWSEIYSSRDASNLLEFGEDVVQRIAATLLDTYGAIPRIFLRRAFGWQGKFRVYEAILEYSRYLIAGMGHPASNTIQALEEAVVIAPNNALVKALLADVHMIMYQYGADKSTLIRGETLGKEALRLDPQCHFAHFVTAFVPYFHGQRELFVRQIRAAVRHNAYNPIVLASAGVHLAFAGEWEEGFVLVRRAMKLNPNFPGWYYVLSLLDAYRHGRFAEALELAYQFNSPQFFWDPLLRAATLGQLGRVAEARTAVQELLELLPDFKTKGRELMLRTLFTEELVDMLLEGLYKAELRQAANM